MSRKYYVSKTSKNPLSAAVDVAGAKTILYISGQLGIDPAIGKLVSDEAGAQTVQVMTNLKNVLEEAGYTMDDVVKTMVYAADRQDMPAINAAYGEVWGDNKPARSAVLVQFPNEKVKVEVEAIAIKES